MANNLMAERKRKRLTREEVGAEIGRSKDTIGSWERGETSPPLWPDGVALAMLFDCSIDWLAGSTNTRTTFNAQG